MRRPARAHGRDRLLQPGPGDHGEVEQAARGGAHALAVVRIDRRVGEHHRAARPPRRRCAARSRVPRITDVGQQRDQRAGVPRPVTAASGTSTNPHTASSPCGVTVCASSLMTSPLTACTATPARRRSGSARRAGRAAAVTNRSVTSAAAASASPPPAAPPPGTPARCRRHAWPAGGRPSRAGTDAGELGGARRNPAAARLRCRRSIARLGGRQAPQAARQARRGAGRVGAGPA